MDSVINLHMTPLQSFIMAAINIWFFVIFPIIVIRKLNYMTTLLEAQCYSDEKNEENDNQAG